MADEDKKVASVQARIETPELLGSTNFWSQVISWGRQVDNTPAWGSTTRAVYLDDFWKADRMLPGVVYTMVSRVASLGWSITGPTEDLHYWHSMILDSDGGYSDLIRLLAKDYFCTDEGAVFEVGRDSYPDGPARQLWHMDARLCIPGPIKASILGANGTPKEVLCDLVFKDVDGYKCMVEGHFHRFCSLPATDQTRRRLGFCFLSRALRAAKLANFLTEYQEEELKDMPPEGIATASGITEAQVRLAIQQHESERQRKEQYTFPGILWIVGNALGQEVKLEWHPFRRLWEKFDERTAWEVFMKTLALDAGLDIAELWQIETTGATKAQVSIQHRKAMGKGPSEFLIDFERTINREILPVGYIFAFDQRDDEQDLLVENIRSMRIRNVRELWRPDPAAGEGLITRDQAMEMLAEEGVIPTRFVAPPEGRLTDITKEVSGLNTATIYHDGTIERHRSYWQLNGKWKEEKATEPFPFDESLHKDSKGGPGSGHHGHLGRPGRHGGSLPGITSVKFGQDIEATLFEKTRNSGKESLALLSTSGEVLVVTDGTTSSVRVVDFPEDIDIILTHSHTLPQSFSRNDIGQFMLHDNLVAIRVIDTAGTIYIVSRLPNWERPSSLREFDSIWRDSDSMHNKAFWDMVLSGKTKQEANTERGHLRMQTVAEILGLKYWRYE